VSSSTRDRAARNRTSGNRAAIKLDGPAALIAAIPHLVGFQPAESLVLVVMGGPRSRVLLTVRADLPTGAANWSELLKPIAHAIETTGGDKLVAIAYPNVPVDDSEQAFDPKPLLGSLIEAADAAGASVMDFLVVEQDRWFSVSEFGEPDGGGGVISIGAVSSAQAALAFEGRAPLASRAELVRSFESVGADDPRAISAEELVQTTAIEASEVCEVLSGETAIDRALQIEILASLPHAHVRDRVISTVLLSAEEHPKGGSSYLRDVAERLRQLQCVAPPGFIAPAATLLGIFAWQAGEGAMATCALGRAVADDPDYRLAHLIEAAVASAMPPWLGRDALIGPSASR
jgi:hypothetical protein